MSVEGAHDRILSVIEGAKAFPYAIGHAHKKKRREFAEPPLTKISQGVQSIRKSYPPGQFHRRVQSVLQQLEECVRCYSVLLLAGTYARGYCEIHKQAKLCEEMGHIESNWFAILVNLGLMQPLCWFIYYQKKKKSKHFGYCNRTTFLLNLK